MNDLQWVTKLDMIRKIFRKKYFFIKKSISSYYYIDSGRKYIIAPVASVETGRVEKLPPKFFEVTDDYSICELEEDVLITERFYKYMEKRGFSL